MEESTVHHFHHSERPKDCSKGHSFRIRFKSKGDFLGWVKVCRRQGCEKVIAVTGQFDSNGLWRRNMDEPTV